MHTKTKKSWLAEILEKYKNDVQPLSTSEKKETKRSATYKGDKKQVLKLWCS